MTDDMTVDVTSGEYLVRRDGDVLRIGTRNGDDVVWLDDVPLSLLPEAARTALENGDGDDSALQLSLRSIAQAEGERGA
jgi:hypothetical protein